MNSQIIIAGSVITGIGALHAIIAKKPLSTAIQGSIVFISLMAILQALSPSGWGKLASSLATLAAAVSVLIELPEILKALGY